jgi:D-alanyl-D-alanine carboxypeptidase
MLEIISRTENSPGRVATAAWLLLAWAAAMFVFPAYGAEIKIAGQAAVLMEPRTGKILWQKHLF